LVVSSAASKRAPVPAIDAHPSSANSGAVDASTRNTLRRDTAFVTPREERVLRMRFGIGMNKDHTLEEVGRHRALACLPCRNLQAEGEVGRGAFRSN
jgi:RNA polymerase primary sigma factor